MIWGMVYSFALPTLLLGITGVLSASKLGEVVYSGRVALIYVIHYFYRMAGNCEPSLFQRPKVKSFEHLFRWEF